MNNYCNLKSLLILAALILLVRAGDFFPWWSFIIPVAALGFLTGWKKWKVASFPIGFLCGFLIWIGADLYFDISLNGVILDKIASLFFIPKIILYIITGIIGGVLTGLAFYTGRVMVFEKESNL